MPDMLTVDSPDAAPTLRQHLDQFNGLTKQRGANYHRSGAVVRLRQIDPFTLGAGVAGSELYAVVFTRQGRTWLNSCTCPVASNCKHAYAVGLAWLAHVQQGGTAPAAPRPDAPATGASGASGEPEAPAVHLPTVLAETLGRALTQREKTFLGTLTQIFQTLHRTGELQSSDVRRLGFDTIETRHGPFSAAYDGWWSEPPASPLQLWQYVAYDLESSGLAVPEFMRPVTDTSLVRAELHHRERREAVNRWQSRFEHLLRQPAAAAASVDQPLPAIDLRLRLQPGKWDLEILEPPGATWKSAKTWLERVARTESALSEFDASPAVIAFLALCHQHYRRHYSVGLAPSAGGGPRLLHQILRHPHARTVVTGPTGLPLEWAPDPLVWHVERAVESPQDYVVGLRFPDGSPLPPGALHLPGEPSLYVHNGVVHRGPPALDGQSAASAIVPAEVVERAEVLRALHGWGAHLPPEIEARFVQVPLRARVVCQLSREQDPFELLEVELLACATEPPVTLVWTDRAWQTVTPPEETAGAEAVIHQFVSTAADAVAATLPAAKLEYDPHRQRWVRRITKTFAEEFLAWRQALPPEVEVLATGELAGLLQAPVRARVDFQVIESAAQRDWFDLALALRPEDTTLTRAEIALLLKARGRLVRLPGKGWRRLTVELDDATRRALEEAGFEQGSIAEAALAGERHRFHALQLAQPSLAAHLPEQQAADLQARARAFQAAPPPELPAGLRGELRPYQKEGYAFLTFLSLHGLGGVLADDMGLGKTLQTLAWLLWLAQRQPAERPLRALVVCPKSVVGNWETETQRFAPDLAVVRFSNARAGTELGLPEGRPVIVVANYTQLRLQAEFFQAQPWDAVVLDEGQFIKNPSSKVAQAARALPGAHRLVLTGTPVENRLLDLWSLYGFALPGLLGSQAAFKRLYAPDDPLALSRLRTRVRHFLLRRTKGQVASDLPPRTEEDVLVELEGDQARLYQAELKRARAQLLGIETSRQFEQSRLNILASLLRLRQICCHPALIGAAPPEAPAAKMEALLERVEELREEGHQVLVFSQFVSVLELIAPRLTASGIDYLLLTGQTENRDELVARFQAERSQTVFLLSLKAAGFGLNLTAASYVILFDPWWNPAVEAQAIDRTHRIGQTQPVNAYRFIARGTVEEKIRALQHEKAALASAVVQEESLARVLDLESLREILS